MSQTPSRSDSQYREIEKFKDYEVTQCIAYEMARRNPEVKALVEERDSFEIFNIETFNESWIERLNHAKSEKETKALITEFLTEDPMRAMKVLKQQEIDERIVELSYFNIRSESAEGDKLIELVDNPYFHQYLSMSSQRAQAKKSSVIDSSTIGDIYEDDGTVKTIAGGTIKYDKLFPPFSRPLPVIPTQTSKEIDIMLNLALPTKDLTALVEKIKKAYEKTEGVFEVATPVQLAANIDREIFTIQIKTKRKGSDTKLEMPEKTQKEVYADLFFLYDVYTDSKLKKQSDKYSHFCYKLMDYYADKVCKYHGISNVKDVYASIGTPNEHTARQYFKIMKSYIDEYGYKSLLA